MTTGDPLLKFTIDQPYEMAVRMVRRALADNGLRTPTELDVTARLRQETCATLAPCIVLFVDDPILMLEAAIFCRGAALYLPQPVVIAGTGRSAEVLIRCREPLAAGLPPTVREPARRLHDRMKNAIQSVAESEATLGTAYAGATKG